MLLYEKLRIFFSQHVEIPRLKLLEKNGFITLYKGILNYQVDSQDVIITNVPNAKTRKSLANGLHLVQKTILQYGIDPDDIYNFDETGFAMGLTATAKIVTRAEYYGRRPLLQPGNREWVTTIECLNASGWLLPPCMIFKGKFFIESWFDNLPNDWRFEVSPNGWTSDEIGLRWLRKLFIPSTSSRTKGKYRLLILDGHGSHLTPSFDQICKENNIIPICMPAHSSHLLQPLDIGCFAVLKRSYSRMVEIENASRNQPY